MKAAGLRNLVVSLCVLAMLTWAATLLAQPSPVGEWLTIDDETGQAKSVVKIERRGKTLVGRVVHIVDPAKRDVRCDRCEGKNKGKKVLGLTILWGLTQDDEAWSGGSILDPKSGREYRCRLRLLDAGRRLEVRGYIGISLFGRSQIWRRHRQQRPEQRETTLAQLSR